MQVFDELLEILKDGESHTFEELAAKLTQLTDNQLECVLGFLHSYDFITLERKHWSLHTKKVKLNPMMTNFLERLEELGKIPTEARQAPAPKEPEPPTPEPEEDSE